MLALSACGGATMHAGSGTAAAGPVSCPLPDGPVAVAASATANSPAVEVSPAVVTVLTQAVHRGEYVALVDTDGSPALTQQGSMRSAAKNNAARAKDDAANLGRLEHFISSSRADDPESDPLGALDTAARTVHAQGTHGTVVLVDSGLQTTGALRYQSDGLLLASGRDVVGHLRSSRQLPDLRGVTVVLSGLGDTAAPQPRLDLASRSRVVDQWRAIATAAGATCVHVDSQPLTQPSPAGLPRVSTVRVPRPTAPKLHLGGPVALREDTVGFQDDSARLRDEATALADLKPLARQIRDAGHQVLLVGTTASAGTEQGRRRLSEQRAEAVKRLLVDLGVPAGKVRTRGAGTHYAAHVQDLDRHGNLVPRLAVRNRAVFVVVRH
jgi:outer membrane protein OmpA-like peptidoglycan-associated protein